MRESERERERERERGHGFHNEGKTKDLKRRSVENERVVGWCWVDCGVENVVPNSLEFVKVKGVGLTVFQHTATLIFGVITFSSLEVRGNDTTPQN